MGSMVSITCDDCKIIEEHYLGIGFMYFPENVFIKNVSENESPIIYDLVNSENIKNIVKDYMEKGAIPGEEYGNDFYYCILCKIVENHFYFYLENNGKIYVPNYECNLCNNNMDRIIDFNENEGFEFENNPNVKIKKLEIKCKKCGGNNTKVKEYGNWD
jgi:(2Fe-2S) ferredoxin